MRKNIPAPVIITVIVAIVLIIGLIAIKMFSSHSDVQNGGVSTHTVFQRKHANN